MANSPFLGEIRIFAGSFAPRNWAMCNGQLMAIRQSTALFSLLGTYYGGDGVTTFGLPDLRGRVPLHWGTGTGLSQYVLGEMVGDESVPLNTSQMAMHTHAPGADAGDSGNASPTNAVWGHPPRVGGNIYTSSAPTVNMLQSLQTGITGGADSHENRQPFLALTFIICLSGVFPSRN